VWLLHLRDVRVQHYLPETNSYVLLYIASSTLLG
jgi:hypothetical protein